MFLIIQIILTVWAWNRGWKSKALGPIAIALSIGLMAGAWELPVSAGMMIIVELGAIIALAMMVINKKVYIV
jgi:hypothetical protein